MRPWPMKKPKEIRPQAVAAPPGQFVTEKFPVFTHGDNQKISLNEWRFRIYGLVDWEVTLDWEQFKFLPQVSVTADFHCVTQWSRMSNLWEGVLFSDVINMAVVKPDARFVVFHCYGGYTANLPLEALLDNDVLFAHSHDGKPLSPEHGGPMRLVVPKRYGWKSAKWVNGMELLSKDKAGFWEELGYNNNADPWKEERFWDGLG